MYLRCILYDWKLISNFHGQIHVILLRCPEKACCTLLYITVVQVECIGVDSPTNDLPMIG